MSIRKAVVRVPPTWAAAYGSLLSQGRRLWWMSLAILTLDRARSHRHGGWTQPANRIPHDQHRHALDSLYHHRGAGAGRAQCDAAAIDRAARHLGRHQYPLSVRLSVLDRVLRHRAGCDRRCRAMADGRVLAVAVARRAQPDPRHRTDAGRHERPLVRGDDGVSE